MTGARWQLVVHDDAEQLARATADRLIDALGRAVDARGSADVVLTGGGIGVSLLRALAERPSREAVDWGQVRFWWGDERFLPSPDPERNETAARTALLDHLPVEPANVHPIVGPERVADPQESAADYAAQLAEHAPAGASVPLFDVVLLGVGPDGHVASLFPGRPEVEQDATSVVAVRSAPKPPPLRVSLSLPSLRHARAVWFVVSGAGKSRAVERCAHELPPGSGLLEDPSCDPAARVLGREETIWLVDRAAAAELSGRRAAAGSTG